MPSSILGITHLNQYHVEEFVTLTSLGELYRATDARSGKSFALTLLVKTFSKNREAVKNFEAHASSLQSISHPNLTKYLGIYQTPTLAFLLEEWVDGPSLLSVLEKWPVNLSEALTYAKAICSALAALHNHNYLHLNLAPELIHINQRGEILVSGLAGAHPNGVKNPHKLSIYPQTYTSPEQLKSRPLDTAADIYALTVIIYELITGTWINGKRAPKSNEAIRKIHLEGSPPAPIALNPEIPDHFSRMILWALRKNPDDRLKTTTELLSSLPLAARVSLDTVPLRTDPITAPVTSRILGEWKFMPPAKPNILSADTPPLEDRLASLTVPKKKSSRIGITPIILFILFITLFFLFCASRGNLHRHPSAIHSVRTRLDASAHIHPHPKTHKPARWTDRLHLHPGGFQPTLHDQPRRQRTLPTDGHAGQLLLSRFHTGWRELVIFIQPQWFI